MENVEKFENDDEHKAVYTCDAGYATSENKTTFETHCIISHSISAEMLTIAVCATCGPHRTCVDGVSSYSCDCDPAFREMDIDGEKVCGNIDDCGCFSSVHSRWRSRRESSAQSVADSVGSRDQDTGRCGAQSILLIHTIASVGKLELEQTSRARCIFQITNEFEFWNFSN